MTAQQWCALAILAAILCGSLVALCVQWWQETGRVIDRHVEEAFVTAPDTPAGAGSVSDYRLALLRAVIAYDNANQSDLPLTLLDSIRAEVGGPR